MHRIRPCQLFAEWLQLKLRQRAIHSPLALALPYSIIHLDFIIGPVTAAASESQHFGPRIKYTQADKRLLKHALPLKLNTEQHASSHQHQHRIHLFRLFSFINSIKPALCLCLYHRLVLPLAMAPAKKRARNAQSEAQPSSVLLADYRTAWLLAYVSISLSGFASY